jgi:hypothetical protein
MNKLAQQCIKIDKIEIESKFFEDKVLSLIILVWFDIIFEHHAKIFKPRRINLLKFH